MNGRNNMSKKNSEKGFSLIETLISVLILGFAAIALVELMALGIRINTKTKDETQVATLAQQQLETLTYKGYSALVDGGSLTPTAPPDPAGTAGYYSTYTENDSTTNDEKDFHQNAVIYHIYWTIQSFTASADLIVGLPYREITVRVVCDRIESTAGVPREVTVRAQVVRPF